MDDGQLVIQQLENADLVGPAVRGVYEPGRIPDGPRHQERI
jgi:hypothetical protein